MDYSLEFKKQNRLALYDLRAVMPRFGSRLSALPNPLKQRFSTGTPQEFLKHAMPDYLVRSTDLSSLRLSN